MAFKKMFYFKKLTSNRRNRTRKISVFYWFYRKSSTYYFCNEIYSLNKGTQSQAVMLGWWPALLWNPVANTRTAQIWKQMLCAHCLFLTVNYCSVRLCISQPFAFCPSTLLCWSMKKPRRMILFQCVFSTVYCHSHFCGSAFSSIVMNEDRHLHHQFALW